MNKPDFAELKEKLTTFDSKKNFDEIMIESLDKNPDRNSKDIVIIMYVGARNAGRNEQNTKSSIIITELLDIIQSQSEALESCGCFCGSFDFDKLACISCSALSETNTRLQKLRGGEMNTENKFREFWVNDDNSIVKFVFKCKSQIESVDIEKPNIVHAIEIAAVEQLKAEIKSLEEDCVTMREHQALQIENNNFRAEITALKSKLAKAKEALEFYGDRESYVEDQEFHTIDSLNNDDEFLEKYQARVGGKTARQALKEIEG